LDLGQVLAGTGCDEGTVWTLEGSEELNANLVRFSSGGGVGKHTNEEVDVILVGVSGSGRAVLEGTEHHLTSGRILLVPRGASREIQSTSEDFAYLSIHRRRGPVKLGQRPRAEE
jgi:quercetin dioxygenase-like cupin family protein